MLFLLILISSIHSVILLSSHEDLSITKYSQIGCLKLKSDKEFLVKNLQENILLPYQTLITPSMTIELCFRLCRRWYILLSNNGKHCTCLYTINQLHEIPDYLGEYIPKENCTSNSIEIYSLTDNLDILSPVPISLSNDKSLDGCYYINGIQTVRVDRWLTQFDYIQAMNTCQQHCQTFENTKSFSFYLSRKKSCYCSPLKLSQTAKTIALRKPLRHCSFHPYLCQGFTRFSCNQFYTNTDMETLIKIDVQQYCFSNISKEFVFDKVFNRCYQIISFTNSNIISQKQCLPLTIQTLKQWNYLTNLTWIKYSKTFIPITSNSTYIFKILSSIIPINDLCLVLYRTASNEVSYELSQCSQASISDSILCIQQHLASIFVHNEDFQDITNSSTITHEEILTCPSNFVLFGRMCYYVSHTFSSGINSGERMCYEIDKNSTLLNFDVQERGNINATKFLGRRFDDLLIEFLYFILENKLLNQTKIDINRKNWLRLLLRNKHVPSECIVKYFERPSGTFTTLYQCHNGGYAVCQIEPVQTFIPIISTTESSSTTTTFIEITDSTICENCTITTNMVEIFNSTERNSSIIQKNKSIIYQPLLVILTGPILAFTLLAFAILFLTRYLRKTRDYYSPRSSITGSRRIRRSSTAVTNSDLPGLFRDVNSPRISLLEPEILLPSENLLIPNDETIELIPANHQNELKEKLITNGID